MYNIYIYIQYTHIHQCHIQHDDSCNITTCCIDPHQSHDIFPKKDTLQRALKKQKTSSRCPLSVTLPSLHHACWKWNALKGTWNVWYQPLGFWYYIQPPNKTGVPECHPKKWLKKNLIYKYQHVWFQDCSREKTSLILRHLWYCLECLDAVFFGSNDKMVIHTNWCKPEAEHLEDEPWGFLKVLYCCIACAFLASRLQGCIWSHMSRKKLLFGRGRGHGIVRKLFGLRFLGCDVWGRDVYNRP